MNQLGYSLWQPKRRVLWLGAVCSTAGLFYSTAPSSCHASATTSIRVASYNVLSDSLCSPDHFSQSSAADCDPNERFIRVKSQLQEQIDKKAVLCLQEVSRQWGAKLVPFFESNGYTYVAAGYGAPYSGYMGQCIAWPADLYSAADVDVTRLTDSVKWPKTKQQKAHKSHSNASADDSIWGWVLASFGLAPATGKTLKQHEKADHQPTPFDVWAKSKARFNVAILARLNDKMSGHNFVVGNYHMPCLFRSDEECQVMIVHASLLMQHAQRFACTDPLIVAGDFNIKPRDPCYKLISEGSMALSHAQHPPPAPFDDVWTPSFEPMRSAYMEKNSEEPAFTNYAQVTWHGKLGDPFCETLDYIWMSPHWKVNSVHTLPDLSSLKGIASYPTSTEPSDHLLIAADLTLANE